MLSSLVFLLMAAAGCSSESGGPTSPPDDQGSAPDQGPASDLAVPDGGDDAGLPADGEAEDASPDAAGADAGEQDGGPSLPDLQLPDLGPLDLGLKGCQLEPCPGNQLCDEEGRCQEPAACTGDLDCLGGRICTDGSCAEPCRHAEDCPGVTWCHVPSGRCRESGSCETSAGCLAGNVCQGMPGRCVPAPPPACSVQRPCSGGLLCGRFGECEEPLRCAAQGDCLAGRFCGEQGSCVACRNDDDCPGGQTCSPAAEGGQAACSEPAPCAADEDCRGTRVCAAGGSCGPAGGCEPDLFEPDDAPGQGRLVGARRYQRTFCDGETDRLVFAVPAGQGLVLTVQGDQGAVLDPSLVLQRAESGAPLGFFATSGPVEVAIMPLASVDLNVEALVRGRPGDQGPYTVSAELVPGGLCTDDAGESHGGDDVRERARRIGPGLHAARLCPADQDWYELPLAAAGSRLTARLDRRQLDGEANVALYLDGGAAVLRGGEVVRENMPAGSVWLQVSGGDGGPYTLLVDLASPEGMARCAAAPALAPGAARQGSTAGTSTAVNSCGPVAAAGEEPVRPAEALFRIELATDAAMDLTLSGAGDPQTSLALRSLCTESGSELGCQQGEAAMHLPLVAAGSYVAVVQGGTAEAPASFTLLLTTGPPEAPPVHDLCAGARPIPPFNPQGAATVSGTLLRAGNELEPQRCSPPAGLPEVFYDLHLEEESLLTVHTEGANSPWLTLVGSCGLPVELGCAAPGRKLMVNALPAGDYVLVAQGLPAEGTDGSFVLKVKRDVVAGPDTCMGAESIGLGATFNRETSGISKYNLPPRGCTNGNTSGADMPFHVHLDAGQTLRAELLADWDGAIYLVQDCEDVANSCVAGKDEEGGGVEEKLEYRAAQAGEYFLVVDAFSRESRGPFRLTAAVDGDCLSHRDCGQGFRCISFHCVQPECAVDADCPAEGARCEEQRCQPAECNDHAVCMERGTFCVQHRCAPVPGEALGSGLLGLSIPDDDLGGVVTAIEAWDLGTLAQVLVQVELDHPYRGDLVVSLVSPSGTKIRLHNQTGGASPFGPVVYGLTREPDGPGMLAELAGEPSAGRWLLEVADLSPGDAGTLQGWALYLVGVEE